MNLGNILWDRLEERKKERIKRMKERKKERSSKKGKEIIKLNKKIISGMMVSLPDKY